MLVREQKQSRKGTGVFISLVIHAVLVALLLAALTEKRLTPSLVMRSTPADEKQTEEEKKNPQPKPTHEKKQPGKAPALSQPFVVPAPVVFYGNQAMMNNPIPVSGHSDGKSAFEHTPSALPTPPTQAIAPERTPLVTATEIGEKAQLPTDKELAQPAPASPGTKAAEEKKIEQEKTPDLAFTTALLEEKKTVKQETSPSEKRTSEQHEDREQLPLNKQAKNAKKLTLADLFKNATTAIASFAQDGLPSARKAGTEKGDDLGSGHQITIKEGDMRYYALWANFLNHLNQSAHFSRRGKELLIQNWINNREIQYILQCGITIDTQGRLLDIEIVVSSGCRGFDEMCVNDIRAAVPYPPLPESLGKKTARFEVNVYP